jgi:hypothetical protein
MSSSADRVQHLTQKLADYVLLYQKCSDKMIPYSRVQIKVIYDEARKEWQSDPSNPLVEPPRGDSDRAKIDAHFATCDSICSLKPRNAHEYVPSCVSRALAELTTAGLVIARSVSLVGLECKLSKAKNSLICPTGIRLSPPPASSRRCTVSAHIMGD